MDDIEKLLKEEQSEIKKTFSGVRGRASSKKGFKGPIVFPSTYLKGKAKQEYLNLKNNGKVYKVYNMYDNVIPFEEFEKLPEEKRSELLTKWKEKEGATSIINTWNISKAKFYSIARKLNIPLNSKRRKSVSAGALAPLNEEAYDENEIRENQFIIILNGEYDGKTLVDKLMKMGGVLEEEGKNYRIKLEILEK